MLRESGGNAHSLPSPGKKTTIMTRGAELVRSACPPEAPQTPTINEPRVHNSMKLVVRTLPNLIPGTAR